jgi:hypothetical protein
MGEDERCEHTDLLKSQCGEHCLGHVAWWEQ